MYYNLEPFVLNAVNITTEPGYQNRSVIILHIKTQYYFTMELSLVCLQCQQSCKYDFLFVGFGIKERERYYFLLKLKTRFLFTVVLYETHL